MDATIEHNQEALGFLEDVLLEVRPVISQRYIRSLSSISHRFDVDDLYQSVCIRAFRSISKCNGQTFGEVRNWVLKIAANVFRSAIATHKLSAKRSTNRERCVVATSGDEPHVEPWTEPVESMQVVVDEQCQHMRACIDRLPRSQQRIVVMRFLEQRSYIEIADELGVTVQAARTSVSQAVKRVRAEMPQRNLTGFE